MPCRVRLWTPTPQKNDAAVLKRVWPAVLCLNVEAATLPRIFPTAKGDLMVRLCSGGAGLLLLGLGASALAAGGRRLLLVAAVLPAGHPRDQHLHAKEHMSAHSTYRTAPGIAEMSI